MSSIFDYRSCLFLSPHLDDAVFSVGGVVGLRAMRGLYNTVATIFAGSPPEGTPISDFAVSFHEACGLYRDAVGRRRWEDMEAMRVLDAGVLHGSFPDAIYRLGPSGNYLYGVEGSTFGQLMDSSDLRIEIDEYIRSAVRCSAADAIVGPRAVGDHVDHVLVRDSAISVATDLALPIWLWEDQPYTAVSGSSRLGEEVIVGIDSAAWARKMEATSLYESQLMMFRNEALEAVDLIDSYGRHLGLEYGMWAERIGRYT